MVVPVHFEKPAFVGAGCYGEVQSFTDKRSGTLVAIKMQRDIFGNGERCKFNLREAKILSQLTHPNVRLLAVHISSRLMAIGFLCMSDCDIY